MVEKERFFEAIRQIPKAEIHLHSEDFVAKKSVPVQSLREFLSVFRALRDSLNTTENFKIMFDNIVGYMKQNGIVYAEVFFGPKRSMELGLEYSEIVNIFEQEIKRIKKEENLRIRILIEVSRTYGPESAETILDLVIKHRSDYIVGIGLGGDEKIGPARNFVHVFEKAKKHGLRTVAHAGESDGYQSILDTVEMLKADRIGHGISADTDDETLQLLVKKQIPLELAPTSNLITGRYVKDLEEHPIRKYWNSGVFITLNSDDPTLFNTSLVNEYWNLYNIMGYEFNHLYRIIINGFQASFLSKRRKREYIKKVNEKWREIVLMEQDIKGFVKEKVEALKKQLKGKKVLCALSGGVDSAVTATLIHKACPESLICVFVDHGLIRKNEADEVMRVFRDERKMNLIKIDAQQRFLTALKGITDPEQKRKIIGGEFIRVFEEYAKKIGKVDFLAQGTIQSDVVESGIGAKLVKSHHNVGGLPDIVDFKEIIEPLRSLYKDEVRKVGLELGLPKEMVIKQPFPGPGLGVRVIGEITHEKLEILREADFIFREEIAKAKLDTEIWQYFAILADMRSTGVKDGARTYDYTIALRAVNSKEGISADFARIPYDVLAITSARIVDEVQHVNRVVYDITTKPPATIEWE